MSDLKVGRIYNEVGFEIDKSSFKKLKQFREEIASVREAFKSLSSKVSLDIDTSSLDAIRKKMNKLKEKNAKLKEQASALKDKKASQAKQDTQKIVDAITALGITIKQHVPKGSSKPKQVSSDTKEGAIQAKRIRAKTSAAGMPFLSEQQKKTFYAEIEALSEEYRMGRKKAVVYNAELASLTKTYSLLNKEAKEGRKSSTSAEYLENKSLQDSLKRMDEASAKDIAKRESLDKKRAIQSKKDHIAAKRLYDRQEAEKQAAILAEQQRIANEKQTAKEKFIAEKRLSAEKNRQFKQDIRTQEEQGRKGLKERYRAFKKQQAEEQSSLQASLKAMEERSKQEQKALAERNKERQRQNKRDSRVAKRLVARQEAARKATIRAERALQRSKEQSHSRMLSNEEAWQAKKQKQDYEAWLKRDTERTKREAAVQAKETRTGTATMSFDRLSKEQREDLKESLQALGAAYIAGKTTTAEYNAQVERQVKRFRTLNRQTRTLTESFKDLKHSLVGAGIAYGAFQGASTIVTTGQAFDSIEAKARVATGSAQKAAEWIKFAQDESLRLGRAILPATDNFTKLAIAAKGALSDTETKDLFTGVMEVSTAMDLTTDEVNRGMRAMQQMLSKGVISSDELRNQLAEALPGSVEAFAKAMNVSKKELFDMVESGKLLTKDVLPKVSKEFAKMAREGGALELKMNSNRAAMNRMASAFQMFLRDIFWAGVSDASKELFLYITDLLHVLKPLAEFLSSTLKRAFLVVTAPIRIFTGLLADLVRLFSDEFGDNALLTFLNTGLSEIVGWSLGILGIVKGWGLMKLAIAGVGSLLLKITPMLVTIRGLMAGIWAFSVANPIGLAVLAVVGSLAYLYANWEEVTSYMKESWELLAAPVRGFFKTIANGWEALGENIAQAKAWFIDLGDTITQYFSNIWDSISMPSFEDFLPSFELFGNGTTNIEAAKASLGSVSMPSVANQINMTINTDGSKLAEAVSVEIENNNQTTLRSLEANLAGG